MKRFLLIPAVLIFFSCGHRSPDAGKNIITVSIAPFSYFITEIAGDDFTVNVMVPPGANPHVFEPWPGQIDKLRRSVAYISNGFLGFEMTWLDRFYEINKTMVKLTLGGEIDPISSAHSGVEAHGHSETADPHYWVSPVCALTIAGSVRDLLCDLNPSAKEIYEMNFAKLTGKINEADNKAQALFSQVSGMSFMIYHPNLAYLARDYGLEEIAVEFEGKEPSPSRLKDLIDLAAEKNINTIFVQKEYDSRNAKTIAGEIGAKIEIIDPLSENWYLATMNIINCLYNSLVESRK